VFTKLFQWFFSNLSFGKYALDFDSTIMTRYGRQEGAAKGYNPKKISHNFWDTEAALNFVMMAAT
jgi:hypothetical protein